MRRALAALAVTWSTAASAQGLAPRPLPRAEIVAGWGVAGPASGGTLTAAYAPPLLLGGTAVDSRSSQVVAVDSETGRGFEFGVNTFLGRVWGVQAAVAWSRADVTGPAGAYDVALRYVAQQPPDFQPREFSFDATSSWPATTGALHETTALVGAVARWSSATGKVGGTAGGGASLAHVSGEVISLAYTQFVLGGHATLFPVHHGVVVTPDEDQWAWRPYVATDLHVTVARRMALCGGIRLVIGPRRTVLAAPLQLVDPAESPWTPDIQEVRSTLGPQPLELPGSRWRALLGVKIFVAG